MSEGYHAAGNDDCKYSWLDEFLCEYVDGTMDPSARATFEEYLRGNPELAAHVECLRRARHLLGHYGCSLKAPHGLQTRLRRQLACEMVRPCGPRCASVVSRLSTFALGTSAVLVMLLAGMLTGVLFLPEPAEPVAVSQRSPAAVPEAPAPRAVVPLHRVDYPFHPRLGGMPLLVHSEREAPSYPLVVDSLLKGLQRTSAAP